MAYMRLIFLLSIDIKLFLLIEAYPGYLMKMDLKFLGNYTSEWKNPLLWASQIIRVITYHSMSLPENFSKDHFYS